MSTTTDEPIVACDQCDGVIRYRVRLAGYPHQPDNFDQLSDHLPQVFTWLDVLKDTAEHRDGRSITVWRLADADRGGDWIEDTVLAYAGPHPNGPEGETTVVHDLSGHGFYAELVGADL